MVSKPEAALPRREYPGASPKPFTNKKVIIKIHKCIIEYPLGIFIVNFLFVRGLGDTPGYCFGGGLHPWVLIGDLMGGPGVGVLHHKWSSTI